jgi:hypothetical protein
MANWIKGAIQNPGALRKVAAEHGGIDKSSGDIKQSFLKSAESGKYGETNARRARLAETLEGMHKK